MQIFDNHSSFIYLGLNSNQTIMKSNRPNSFVATAIIMALGIILIQSCTKTPTPVFSYEPSVNPEAGDSIFFLNNSIDATIYDWDFGDESTSTEMDPSNIYIAAGSYDVKLTASNEKKSEMLTQTIIINDPTVLGMYVYEDDEETVVPAVSVWVYDNESDWQNFNDPQFESLTDSDGFALFLNLEAQEYIVDLYLEVEGGYWSAAFNIPTLVLNEIALYGLAMEFVPDSKKSLERKRIIRDEPLPARLIKK